MVFAVFICDIKFFLFVIRKCVRIEKSSGFIVNGHYLFEVLAICTLADIKINSVFKLALKVVDHKNLSLDLQYWYLGIRIWDS